MLYRSGILKFYLINFFLILYFGGCSLKPHLQSKWDEQPDRVWVGSDYWANRLQDWRVNDGRLECVEASDAKPMRVVHLLTGALRKANGSFEMSVKTGPVDQGQSDEHTWTGFLIGAGAEDIDYRLTALVHHKPAEDGGIFAGINGTGQVIFRDFSHGGGGDTWAIRGKLFEKDMPVIKPVETKGKGFGKGIFQDVILNLSVKPAGNAYSMTLYAKDLKSGELISETVLGYVPPDQVEGSVALVSHGGPVDSKNGYWFKKWQIKGSKFVLHPERRFGPVFCAQHTLSKGVLKLTAQMPPLGEDDNKSAELQIKNSKSSWKTVAVSKLTEDSYTFPFRVGDWNAQEEAEYRVVYELKDNRTSSKPFYWTGKISAEPVEKDTFVVAAFTGNKIFTGGLKWNHNGIWFPHNELVSAVAYHKPDFLFFSGDQVYEGDLTGAQYAPLEKAVLDYLDKWYRWCWAFGDLVRDIPTICIPDDHDVYHGNIWGAGGRKVRDWPKDDKYPKYYTGFERDWQQDGGGYKMPPEFVNMVHRTQTSHLPDPFDPTPVDQGIDVYYTNINYGGMSFAVIEDRKWKSSPSLSLPDAWIVNGFIQNPKFDKRKTDNPRAKLLGDRQLRFLDEWASDWTDTWMKVVLSQTIFATVSTYPTYFITDAGTPDLKPLPFGVIPDNYELAIDMDSNGWPQTGRNKALRAMRKAFALHIAGDQHLGSTIQYGIDNWHDAGYAVCVPSIGNTWPRRWYPHKPGKNHKPGDPLYTGDYRDGFGNLMSVYAVSNPIISGHEPSALHDRATGYGIIRFERKSRDITIEVWPRWADPSKPDAEQYRGWPVNINQSDNYSREARAYLPTLRIKGMTDPVVQVIDEKNKEIVYTLRIKGQVFTPKVFKKGKYTIKVGELGTSKEKVLENVAAVSADEKKEIEVRIE